MWQFRDFVGLLIERRLWDNFKTGSTESRVSLDVTEIEPFPIVGVKDPSTTITFPELELDL